MIDIINSRDPVLALRLQGEISAADIALVKKTMAQKLATHASFGLAVDFSGFSDATEEAIREDIRFEMDFLPQLARLPRIAVVTDKQWLGAFISYAGHLLPSVELKLFSAGKLEQAIVWSGLLPAATRTNDKQTIRRIATDRDDTFAFEIDGTMHAPEAQDVMRELEDSLDKHDKLRMLMRVGNFGVDWSVLSLPNLFSTKLAAMRKVERYAIVGAPGWMSGMVKAVNPLFPGMDMRSFSGDDEADAWAWLEAKPSN